MTEDPKDFVPDSRFIYYKFGRGLIYFEPVYYRAFLHAALFKGDMGKGSREKIDAIFDDLKSKGFTRVFSIIDVDHKRARLTCRLAGMKLKKTRKESITYERIL